MPPLGLKSLQVRFAWWVRFTLGENATPPQSPPCKATGERKLHGRVLLLPPLRPRGGGLGHMRQLNRLVKTREP